MIADPYLRRFLPAQTFSEQKTPPPCQNAGQTARFSIEYVGERCVEVHAGDKLLDISQHYHIPHMCVCGGIARCSTCRVDILDGLNNCAPRTEAETQVALAKNFPPNIRLACQTQVQGPVRLRRLVLDDTDAEEAMQRNTIGKERKLAVLFCDVRAFTPFVENNLAYDVVHLLNRYFNAIGEPIHANYGYIDKYIGDGIMVLFGLDPQRNACVDAVNAALGMQACLETLNAYCSTHFQHDFRIGIGIHYGPVIIGDIGFRLKRDFTALGDVVNTASRIEAVTKEVGAPLLVSASVKKQLPDGYQFGQSATVSLKGKSGEHVLYEITG